MFAYQCFQDLQRNQDLQSKKKERFGCNKENKNQINWEELAFRVCAKSYYTEGKKNKAPHRRKGLESTEQEQPSDLKRVGHESFCTCIYFNIVAAVEREKKCKKALKS